MAGFLQDIGNVDVNLVGEFGLYTIRNYGEDGTSIDLAPMDDNLYNEHAGALGDLLVNKSYKPQNMILKLKVLRFSADYAKLKNIVSLELTGQAVLFAVGVVNNNNKERFYAPQCYMKKAPGLKAGADPAADEEFQIIMPSVVYTPPTLS